MSTTRIESKQESKKMKTTPSILSIQNAKDIIVPFKSLSKSAGQAQFVEGALNNLNTLTEEEIEDFSKILNSWAGENSLSMVKMPGVNYSFADVLYQVSLALAAAKPINEDDFATAEKIALENRVVTSDRYQFDINSIVHWINTKGSFENPYTKCQFNLRDQATIKNMAGAKRIKITEKKSSIDEDPALLAGALSAIEQEEKDDFTSMFDMDDLFSSAMPMLLFGSPSSLPEGNVTVTEYVSSDGNVVRSVFSSRRSD